MKSVLSIIAFATMLLFAAPEAKAVGCSGAQARTILALHSYINALRHGSQTDQIRARINWQNAMAEEARLCRIK